jgi:hypothetical protein
MICGLLLRVGLFLARFNGGTKGGKGPIFVLFCFLFCFVYFYCDESPQTRASISAQVVTSKGRIATRSAFQ